MCKIIAPRRHTKSTAHRSSTVQSVSVGTPNACAIDATRLLSPVGTAHPASSARAAPRDQAALATASSARAAPRDRISRGQRVFVAPEFARVGGCHLGTMDTWWSGLDSRPSCNWKSCDRRRLLLLLLRPLEVPPPARLSCCRSARVVRWKCHPQLGNRHPRRRASTARRQTARSREQPPTAVATIWWWRRRGRNLLVGRRACAEPRRQACARQACARPAWRRTPPAVRALLVPPQVVRAPPRVRA